MTPTSMERPEAVASLPDHVLDSRIRAGFEEWAELVDDLSHTGGMLPSRQLAARLSLFLGDCYWRAEEARVEMLRRQLPYDRPMGRHVEREGQGVAL
jgi:hypothetical protein